jgi:hypothetical protein
MHHSTSRSERLFSRGPPFKVSFSKLSEKSSLPKEFSLEGGLYRFVLSPNPEMLSIFGCPPITPTAFPLPIGPLDKFGRQETISPAVKDLRFACLRILFLQGLP